MEDKFEATRQAAAESQSIKDDPTTTATGSTVGIAGRKGGATPVAVYDDVGAYRNYDATYNFSDRDKGTRNFWLALLIAVVLVGLALSLITPSLLFPDDGRPPISHSNMSSAPAPNGMAAPR